MSDAHLATLVELGTRIADLYGQPQDIEWTRVGDEFSIVQSRAVTNLYPLPAAEGPDLPLWLSFGGFQGMLDPITPLGQDVLRGMMAGAAQVFGRTVDPHTNAYLQPAGQRLWVRADRMLRREPALARRLLPVGDPAAASIISTLVDEDAFAPVGRGARLRTARTLAPFLVPVAARSIRSLADPDGARARLVATTESFLAGIAARLDAAARLTRPDERLRARVRAMESAAGSALRTLLPVFGPIMLPSTAMLVRIRALAAQTGLPDADALALSLLRSLPGNVTTEMDLALYRVARTIRADPDSAARFAGDPAMLAESYLAGTLPPAAQAALADFMRRYGMRGVAEIDVGTPRWRDQPEGVMRTLASYLALDERAAPDVAHDRGRREAHGTIDRLAAALPPLKARQLRFLAGRLRRLFGARETPKFTLVRALGQLRLALLASGEDLVAVGALDRADDIFFLTLDELRTAFTPRATNGAPDLRADVAARRAVREREFRRTRIPIVLVGDGRTFYSAISDSTADLAGLGVSPGVVEGRVRVVADPRTSALEHGEILVCRGTDPAWTPLFLTAAALITEVGGLMTHGSVVAREYGLPAVVGVSDATVRLTTGQRIRIDGSAGAITLLDAAGD